MFSRPDLLYHLSRVAQSCSDPNESDMLRIKKIFSYILYTKNKKLFFSSNKNFNLECFVDASNNCYLDGKVTMVMGSVSGNIMLAWKYYI